MMSVALGLAPHVQGTAEARRQPRRVGVSGPSRPRCGVQAGQFGEAVRGLVGRVGAVAVQERCSLRTTSSVMITPWRVAGSMSA